MPADFQTAFEFCVHTIRFVFESASDRKIKGKWQRESRYLCLKIIVSISENLFIINLKLYTLYSQSSDSPYKCRTTIYACLHCKKSVRVTRIRKSKNRHHNGKKKKVQKDKHRSTKHTQN
jgi:hypothetical protein